MADINGDPDLRQVMAYKGIYALCTVDKSGRALKATHWASVLVGGPMPIWGVWSVNGKFLRFYSYRSQIEEAYPKLVWRRRMATWHCVDITDKSVASRRTELAETYGKPVPEPEE